MVEQCLGIQRRALLSHDQEQGPLQNQAARRQEIANRSKRQKLPVLTASITIRAEARTPQNYGKPRKRRARLMPMKSATSVRAFSRNRSITLTRPRTCRIEHGDQQHQRLHGRVVPPPANRYRMRRKGRVLGPLCRVFAYKEQSETFQSW
jgi:hypothetical protein